jgi:hypothetical protein
MTDIGFGIVTEEYIGAGATLGNRANPMRPDARMRVAYRPAKTLAT